MDREKYLENTGGIVKMKMEELLDEIERLRKVGNEMLSHINDEDMNENGYTGYDDILDKIIEWEQALQEGKMNGLENIKLGDYWHCMLCGKPTIKGKIECDKCIKNKGMNSLEHYTQMLETRIERHKILIKKKAKKIEQLKKTVEKIWKEAENVSIDKRISVIRKAINIILDLSEQALKEEE